MALDSAGFSVVASSVASFLVKYGVTTVAMVLIKLRAPKPMTALVKSVDPDVGRPILAPPCTEPNGPNCNSALPLQKKNVKLVHVVFFKKKIFFISA